jgi:hypothetical protein
MASNMEPSEDFRNNPALKQPFWDRPPDSKQGDEDGDLIYMAVGFALSCWEMAEEDLAALYLTLIDAPHTSDNPARRAYGSIESNTGRRKAISAAAEAYFGDYWDDKEVQRAFMILVEAVGYAAKRRDDIAHGIVMGHVVDGVKCGSFLLPPGYNTARTDYRYRNRGDDAPRFVTLAKYRFLSEDVRHFGHKFRSLGDTIRKYRGLVRRHGGKKEPLMVRILRGLTAFDP